MSGKIAQERVARRLCILMDDDWSLGKKLYMTTAAEILADIGHYELTLAVRGAVGALEFSRDYHGDLGNEDQAFAQDKLDAAFRALATADGTP